MTELNQRMKTAFMDLDLETLQQKFIEKLCNVWKVNNEQHNEYIYLTL